VTSPTTGQDVRSHTVTPLVQSPSAERNGIVSPDGRWLAYEANYRWQFDIYVRPYPNVNDRYWQVSIGGGTSRSGRATDRSCSTCLRRAPSSA
jgi:Tol biopolymer transport system component